MAKLLLHPFKGVPAQCIAGSVALGIAIGVALVHLKKTLDEKKDDAELSQITLKYWGGRGLMEVPRMMLAMAGKFPKEGGYKDVRVNFGDDAAFAAVANTLDANLGRMPLLETPEGSIGQSAAINFYVATKCGLMGKSTLETAKILAICEHIKELRESYAKLVPFGTAPTAEALDTFFDSNEANDFSGPAVRATQGKRYLKWYMGRLEGLVAEGGFAVGTGPSLAGVLIYSTFGDVLEVDEAPKDFPAYRREPFGSLTRTNAALAKCPKIKAIVDKFANRPMIKKWRAERGPQGF
jgi:glutathione S-transferase